MFNSFSQMPIFNIYETSKKYSKNCFKMKKKFFFTVLESLNKNDHPIVIILLYLYNIK